MKCNVHTVAGGVGRKRQEEVQGVENLVLCDRVGKRLFYDAAGDSPQSVAQFCGSEGPIANRVCVIECDGVVCCSVHGRCWGRCGEACQRQTWSSGRSASVKRS